MPKTILLDYFLFLFKTSRWEWLVEQLFLLITSRLLLCFFNTFVLQYYVLGYKYSLILSFLPLAPFLPLAVVVFQFHFSPSTTQQMASFRTCKTSIILGCIFKLLGFTTVTQWKEVHANWHLLCTIMFFSTVLRELFISIYFKHNFKH